jgi:hypothetical protein
MRQTCLDCVRKHLGQAHVLLDESRLGYPEHFWLAIGHLAEAESESLKENPDIAYAIREARTALIDEPDYPFDVIDFIRKVSDVAETELVKLSSTGTTP